MRITVKQYTLPEPISYCSLRLRVLGKRNGIANKEDTSLDNMHAVTQTKNIVSPSRDGLEMRSHNLVDSVQFSSSQFIPPSTPPSAPSQTIDVSRNDQATMRTHNQINYAQIPSSQFIPVSARCLRNKNTLRTIAHLIPEI